MNKANIIALVVLAVLLIWTFTRGEEEVQGIRVRALGMFSPFVKMRHGIEKAADEFTKPRPTYQSLEDANRQLRIELELLRTDNKKLAELMQENTVLKQALKFKEQSAFDLVPAEVIGRETATWYHVITIDKGSNDGIQTNDTVIRDEGLVGKVTRADEDISEVLLLTDEACKVSARVQGTKENGIIAGESRPIPLIGEVFGERAGIHSKPTLRLRYLDKRADIQPGLVVYSSGQGGIFKPDLTLGTIVSVHPGEVTTEAVVTPKVDFSNLDIVFVVVKAPELQPKPAP